ncbi:AE binding protein 2 jing isoform X2 [Halictus rubicundus]|uniref:AE binding protein 2 jing isoform X2 n=1 Tax=Halictus rubicundus TaxID=77578 RepID=UPI004035C8E7
MADGPSAEDAATDLGDGDSRLTRNRHKRQEVQSATTSPSTGQDTARRNHEDAPSLESHPHHHRQHQPQPQPHQHRPPRRNCHAYAPRRHPTNNNNNNNNINNNHYHRCESSTNENGEHDEAVLLDVSGQRVSKIESVQLTCADTTTSTSTTRVLQFVSPMRDDYEVDAAEEEDEDEDEDDDDDDDDYDYDDDNDEEEEEEEDEDRSLDGLDSVSKKCRASVRVEKKIATVTTTKKKSIEEICNSNGNHNNKKNGGAEGGGGGGLSRVDNAAASSSAVGRRSRPAVFLETNRRTDDEDEDDGDNDNDDDSEDSDRKLSRLAARKENNKKTTGKQQQEIVVADNNNGGGGGWVRADHEELDAARSTDGIASDASGDGGGSSGSSDGAAAAAAVSACSGAAAGGVTANGMAARHHQGSPFKGQVRTAEDTLVGPCGKKRCADRYDSSESSDSGVAVSCGECSSSGTSDITEPGSPCSTSSDEGVAIRGASASPLPSLPKLAPSSQIGTRPHWPWTPPLAATACSTYKRLKGEPEAGAVPRSGAADPTFRGTSKSSITKPNAGHHHHDSQGKITEYFKTQIKSQQSKIKKSSETMSVLVAKSSSEFRRPPTVQRNKGGLAKYLGTVSPTGRGNATGNDWEVRTLTMSPPPTKKTPLVIVPRTNGKMDKKLPKPVPSLPISNDVLKNIQSCKISSIRLTSAVEASPNPKTVSQQSTPTPATTTETTTLDFKGCILAKPHVNENNNLTNGCAAGILGSLRSQGGQDLLSRLQVPEDTEAKVTQVVPADEDDVEEEEEDSRSSESRSSESRSCESRSSESKPPLSPILSAPTTIRFPAREPEKDRQQTTDSGVCRWDKCEDSFESSGELLEHLQAAHINTQTGGDNFVCQWQGCKVQGRSSCSRRWLERHVLSHGGNKPFRCIVDGCGSRFSSQTALERHVNGHFSQPETSNNSGRRSCESGGKLVRRNGKRLRYRRQPWSARLFDYFDSGVMEGLQYRLVQLAKSRTQGRLAETPGNSMALTSQVLARRVELDGKTKVLLRWYPADIEPDEWVLESEVRPTKNVGIRKAASANPEEVSVALYSAISGGAPQTTRSKQRRKPVKNS